MRISGFFTEEVGNKILEFTQFFEISNLKSFLRALWQNRHKSLSVVILLQTARTSFLAIPLEALQREQSPRNIKKSGNRMILSNKKPIPDEGDGTYYFS